MSDESITMTAEHLARIERAAFRRGAEAMREAAGNALKEHALMPRLAEAIRALPLPEAP